MGRGFPTRFLGHQPVQLVDVADREAVDGDNDVAGQKPGGGARAVLDAADLETEDRGSDLVDGADHGARVGVEQHQIFGRGGGDRRRSGVWLRVADRIVNGVREVSSIRIK